MALEHVDQLLHSHQQIFKLLLCWLPAAREGPRKGCHRGLFAAGSRLCITASSLLAAACWGIIVWNRCLQWTLCTCLSRGSIAAAWLASLLTSLLDTVLLRFLL